MRISGAVSGLDTDTLVTQLIALERGPVRTLEAKQNAITKQQEAWRTLSTRLHELESKLDVLRDTAVWRRTTATSANAAVLMVTGQGGVAGAYNVAVTALAKAHSVSSTGHADADSALGLSGMPSINGQAVAIAADDTLHTIAAKINGNSEAGVSAAVVQVSAADFRLALTSKTSGVAGEIVMTDDGGVLAALGLVDAGGLANTFRPRRTRSSRSMAWRYPGHEYHNRRNPRGHDPACRSRRFGRNGRRGHRGYGGRGEGLCRRLQFGD